MSYLVLARKWRPQTLREVVGQDHVCRTLEGALQQGRLAHAYLFSGMRGVGKTSVARILAKAVNCLLRQGADPCQTCEPCREITAGTFVDVLEIDGASNTGVDHVRELQEGARYAPLKGTYKVYIIDEVHMLSRSAFNALLKTLEEPPPHVLFVFATTEPHRIPATILCRCQHFHFRRIRYKDLLDHLRRILEAEGQHLPDPLLARIVRVSEGSLRDALTLLDQVLAFGGAEAGEEAVEALLGTPEHLVFRLVEALLAGKAREALQAIQEGVDQGYDLQVFALDLVETIRNLLVVQAHPEPEALVDRPHEEIQHLQALARGVSPDTLYRLYRLFSRALDEMRWAPIPRFSLEIAALRALALPHLEPLSELLQRLEVLEARPWPSFRGPAEDGPASGKPTKAFSGRTSSPEALWTELVREVARRSPALGACLEGSRVLEVRDNQWVIQIPTGIFALERLQEPHNQTWLEAQLQAQWGQPVRLRFEGTSRRDREPASSVPSPSVGATAGPGRDTKDPSASPVLDPASGTSPERAGGQEERPLDSQGALVQEALRILGGKVMEVRTYEGDEEASPTEEGGPRDVG